MDDAGLVRRGERVGDLDPVAQRLRERRRPARAESPASSVAPPTYSITMKSTPSSERMSWIVTMLGD